MYTWLCEAGCIKYRRYGDKVQREFHVLYTDEFDNGEAALARLWRFEELGELETMYHASVLASGSDGKRPQFVRVTKVNEYGDCLGRYTVTYDPDGYENVCLYEVVRHPYLARLDV